MLYVATFAWLFIGGGLFLIPVLGIGKVKSTWIEKISMLLYSALVTVYMGIFFFLMISSGRGALSLSTFLNCLLGTFIVLGAPEMLCFVFRMLGLFTVKDDYDDTPDESKRLVYATVIYYVGAVFAYFLSDYLNQRGAIALSFTLSFLIATVVYLNKQKNALETKQKVSIADGQDGYAKYLCENIHGLTAWEAQDFCNNVLGEFKAHGKTAALKEFDWIARKVALWDKTDTQTHALLVISGLTGAMVPNGILTDEEARALSQRYMDELLTNWKYNSATTQEDINDKVF